MVRALAEVSEAVYSIDCREGLTLKSPPLPGEPDFSRVGGVYRSSYLQKIKCGFRFKALGNLMTYMDDQDWIPVLVPDFVYTPRPGTPDAIYLPVCAQGTECQGCFTTAPKVGSKTCYFKMWMKNDQNLIIHADICEYNEQIPCKNTCENGQVCAYFYDNPVFRRLVFTSCFVSVFSDFIDV